MRITALHIAVHERNIPMIQFLLSQPDIDPQDTHLHAIKENQPKIALMILDKLKEQNLEHIGPPTDSAEFPAYATPLSVAARYGHYDLIALLKNRDHTLEKPHTPSCACEECRSLREKADPLTLDNMRLYMYEAVSNPIYICQNIDIDSDPIIKAFDLSRELNKAASFDREYYNVYKSLSNQVSELATNLIACARTSDEVELVLRQSSGFARSAKFRYPRLLLALDQKQKSFVANSNIQQVIEREWTGDWFEWQLRKSWLKCLTIIPRIFLLPVIAAVVLVAPKSKRAKFWQIPVNKFLSSVASYLLFLIFVFLQSNINKNEQLRGPPNTGYEFILAIYVMSYLWASTRLCIVHGPRRFFRTPWNWYEIVMLSLFIMSFIFWIAAAIDVRINGQRDLERKYWHKYDSTLIAEGVFCLATIMAFSRLLFICQLDYNLGPLQLSLGKMINDVAKFIVIFTILIIAFTAGTCRLYHYYDEMVQTDDESKIKVQQASSFVNFESSLKTLFWAIFCMSPIESADVIIENLPGETETETIINRHTFTEAIGYIAFASYSFIAVVVALNMMIACMSNTFTKITDNVIVEWIFGRTEVYVDYMLTTTLPPPFNLIPTIEGIQNMVEYIKVLIKPPDDKRARWDWKNCCYIEKLKEDDNEDFKMVTTHLVQRYLRQKSKETMKSDMDELRKELMELKNQLKEALSSA
ncbi:short transient receptor potential channel 5-like [Prorops nasuta]|uniref:short transient receptor potential channel 5-like n=1 Tax=Prorops nasuta TaxID=863751 RepID=UPI0034CDAD9B